MKMYPFFLRFLVIAICSNIVCLQLNAQQPGRIDAAIEDYANAFSPEKAFIHYDKPSYSKGETIWFKVYLMNEITASLDTKTFYTDWFDDKGNLLQHTVSPLVDAVSTGQYDIPVDYSGKYIHVRAYTRWMLNFDSTFIYTKDIRILGNETAAPAAKTPVVSTLSLFPEGGDLVQGVNSRVAFKANDQWGKPIRIRGFLQDGQGKKLDSIRVMHDGMGFFNLIPQPGVKYNVSWKDEKDVVHTTALPEAKSTGFVLQVAPSGTGRRFQVNYAAGVDQNTDSVHLVGTMFQHQVFKVSKAVNGTEIKGMVPVQGLPSGILTITMFDKSWTPLAERITFINNEEYLFQPEFEVKHWGLNKRARNEIQITIPDSIVASLSVAITDAAIGSDSLNIISHLLLSSELKGDIYKPAYYFSSTADIVTQHLDLVMMTHGWRKIKWDMVFSGKLPKPVYGKDTTYMSISGNVYGALPGEIGPTATVVLMVKQKDVEGKVLLVPIKSDGTFNDPQTIIFDTATVYYQFQNKELKKSSLQFMTDKLKLPTMMRAVGNNGYGSWQDTTGNFRQFRFANEANEIAERSRYKTLENVIIRSKSKTPLQLMDEKYTSGLFAGGDGYQFDMLNDPAAMSAMSIFQYLQGRVAGLQITQNGGNVSMNWRGGSPALFLDEMRADVDMINSVNVRDVAYIKVIRPPFLGAAGGGGSGAIAIYTRRGNDIKSEPGKGLANNKVEGYTAIRVFYSPNYASFSQKNEERDVRTTLYWNPSVSLDPKNKTAILTFYNNDISKAFRVIIEGMTRDGRLAHLEQLMD